MVAEIIAKLWEDRRTSPKTLIFRIQFVVNVGFKPLEIMNCQFESAQLSRYSERAAAALNIGLS